MRVTHSEINHRVLKIDGVYAVHEAYYGNDGEVWGWTERPLPALGDDLEELRADLQSMLGALDRPVLVHP